MNHKQSTAWKQLLTTYLNTDGVTVQKITSVEPGALPTTLVIKCEILRRKGDDLFLNKETLVFNPISGVVTPQ